MKKIRKEQSKENSEEKKYDDLQSDQMTYEDFNNEKPLPEDPEFKITSEDIISQVTTKTYSCPIHEHIKAQKPGMCSKCGKLLIENK